MRIEDCFLLGVISSKYSFKGDLLLKVKTKDMAHAMSLLDSCFIMTDGNLVPYFINFKKQHKATSIRVQFDGVDNEILAEALVGKEVYIPLEKLSDLEEESSYHHHQYINYSIFEGKTFVGSIKEVLDLKQPLLCIETESEKEAFIPFVKEFIIKIDDQEKAIYMDLPEGLLDIN